MKNRKLHINFWKGLILVLSLIFVQNASAQEFSVQSDTNRLRIGEQTLLHFELTVSESDWILPQFADTIGPLYVVNSGAWDTLAEAENIIFQREVLVTVFDSGYHAIQPFIAYRGEDSVLTEGLFFEVLTVDSLGQEPYDIKPPLDAPKTILERFWEWYRITVLPLAAIMTMYYLYTLFARRKSDRDDSEQQLSPEEWIVRELDEMERKVMWSSESPKQFYDRLTDALRYYIARKYHYRTTEMVTDEIELVLKGVSPFQERYGEFIALLRKADRAKFAKESFGQAMMQSDFAMTRELVSEWISWETSQEGGEDA